MKKESVDLLIMDIMMPRMDGIRATLKIREKHNIPIIILSAKSEDADKILGLNIGADDYITKPFNPLELVARVKSHLRRYMQLRGKYFLLTRYMKISGMKMRWVLIIQWQCIFVISVRRLRSTRKNQDI